VDAHCTEYLTEKRAKAITEAARTQARTDLGECLRNLRRALIPGHSRPVGLTDNQAVELAFDLARRAGATQDRPMR